MTTDANPFQGNILFCHRCLMAEFPEHILLCHSKRQNINTLTVYCPFREDLTFPNSWPREGAQIKTPVNKQQFNMKHHS